MGLFGRRKKIQNPELMARLSHREIKYVATRSEDGSERVLGHSGGINIKGDELIVFTEGKEVYRCSVYDVEIGELMSRDGVRLAMTRPDGTKWAVTAYYVYRR